MNKSEIKIALIGNMNNNFFCLCRYLRDLGYDAHLFLLNEVSHFLPEADSYDDLHKNYVHQLEFSAYLFENKEFDIKSQLKGFDFFIGCDVSPALFNMEKLSLDIFIPYGGDLYGLPFYKGKLKTLLRIIELFGLSKFTSKIFWRIGLKNLISNISQSYFSSNQKDGIRSAKTIISRSANTSFNQILENINGKFKVYALPIPMIYTPQYTSDTCSQYIQKMEFYTQLKIIRKSTEVIIFHHTRHVWKNPPNEFTQKRNDILLNGLNLFKERNPNISFKLITLNYGSDIQDSKELIQLLGIDADVIWLPQLDRKDIMPLINLADIGAVDFGIPWTTGGVLYEFLAMGIPVMQCDNMELKKDASLYPYLPSNNPEEVCKNLEGFIENREVFKKMGLKGKKWFEDNIVDHPLSVIEELILEKLESK